MRTDAQCIARYEARMNATLIDPVRTATNAAAKANYAAYASEYYGYQVAMHEEISAVGVPVIQWASYEAFLGEVFHAYKHFSGETFVNQANILVAKWSDVAHLGTAARAILMAIVLDVFHSSVAPTTP
jgi:hypothetical protein